MPFPHFKPLAHTRDEVIGAIKKKHAELLREAAFFEVALEKVNKLEQDGFYLLTYKKEYPVACFNVHLQMFVQCRVFGRDHVEFKLLACDMPEEKFMADHKTLIKATGNISFAWHWEFETTPIDPKHAVLYVGWPWKTKHYEKLVKGNPHA